VRVWSDTYHVRPACAALTRASASRAVRRRACWSSFQAFLVPARRVESFS
jgi:hypothetical protein